MFEDLDWEDVTPPAGRREIGVRTASRRTQKAECGNHGEVSALAYRSVNSVDDSHGLDVKSLSPNSSALPL